MRKPLHLFLLLFLLPLLGISQAKFKLGKLVGYFPDSVFSENPYSFGFWVHNTGNASFTGILSIKNKTSYNGQVFPMREKPVSLAAGDSVLINFGEYYFPTNTYKQGHDIIVIWPDANQVAPEDSLVRSLFVIEGSDVTSADGTSEKHGITLFPVPAGEQILIQGLEGHSAIEDVRILDVAGREVLKTVGYKDGISIISLQKGNYFMEIRFKDGEVVRRKFIKN